MDQQIATDGAIPAFRIVQLGTGPNGIFEVKKAADGNIALEALTNGPNPAFRASTTGDDRAAEVFINNVASSAHALLAHTIGTGSAGVFSVGKNSTDGALQALTFGGTGPAGFFLHQTENRQASAAVLARSEGNGGGAGLFEIDNANNRSPALSARTSSADGLAGFFSGQNVALRAITDGGGTGLEVGEKGTPSNSVFWGDANVNGTLKVTSSRFFANLFQVGDPSPDFLRVNSEFYGDVDVFGTLRKSAGSFRIDHPLDPEHKYLSHSFVESPDMMNVYNGNVTLDRRGQAVVLLPEWFDALNRDFRYQLTPLGAPGPNLYIADEIGANRFRIAGGVPHGRVSWQVTGIRQDAYANAHRIRVEEDKSATGRVAP